MGFLEQLVAMKQESFIVPKRYPKIEIESHGGQVQGIPAKGGGACDHVQFLGYEGYQGDLACKFGSTFEGLVVDPGPLAPFFNFNGQRKMVGAANIGSQAGAMCLVAYL